MISETSINWDDPSNTKGYFSVSNTVFEFCIDGENMIITTSGEDKLNMAGVYSVAHGE